MESSNRILDGTSVIESKNSKEIQESNRPTGVEDPERASAKYVIQSGSSVK